MGSKISRMMSYEQFENCIKAIQSDYEYLDKVCRNGDEIDWNINIYDNLKTYDEFIGLLSVMFECDDLLYIWIYEENFGTEKSTLLGENSLTYNVTNLKELYKILCEYCLNGGKQNV